MWLSQQLGSGLIDMGLWTGNVDLSNPPSNKWWGRTILASQLLDMGKYKQAFGALNASFDQFSELLENPDPGLLQGAYLIALQLDKEIGQRFVTFAAEMATIKLPPRHPLRILLLNIQKMGTPQLRQYAHRILESYVATLAIQLGPGNAGVQLMYENLYDTLDFLSHEKEMNFVDSQTIQERQQRQVDTLASLGLTSQAESARMALGFAYLRHEMPEKAERINDSVLEWLQATPREKHSKPLDLWDSLHLRLMCKEKIGTKEDMKRVGEEYVDIIMQELGAEHRRTITAISHLQRSYKKRGYLEEAEELEKSINNPSGADK
jgi:hypothetical protein